MVLGKSRKGTYTMRIINSINARGRNYYLNHFEKTKYGKKLKSLKDSHRGERCFIVGNGPSLTPEDLDMIKDEYSFGFNRIYLMFDKTEWRPTFYCTQDDKIATASVELINEKIETPYVFAPINLNWYYNVDIKTDYYFSPLPSKSEEECPPFCEDIPHYIGVGNTVAYTAIQLAVYMGFKEIYLIGVDHSFRVSQTRDGKIVVNETAKDYFSDAYNEDKDKLFIPKLDVSTLSYIAAQEYAKTHDVEIYNATRGGKLEVFPRVDFDLLMGNEEMQKK